MKKGFLIVGGLIIIAAAGVGGWYYYNNGNTGSGVESIVYVSSVSSLTGEAAGVQNKYAGVVEPQDTVEVKIEGGRKVKEVNVKTGEEVKKGQLLFEYDLSSIQDDLRQAKLDLERLKNEAMSLSEQIATLEKEKKRASKNNQLSYTIEIESNKMNLKKNEYDQKSKNAEIQKLQNATANTEVRSDIDGVIQKIDTSKISTGEDNPVEDTMVDEFASYGMYGGNGTENNAFITILSTGAYRIKGQVNELNADSIIEGSPVIIRSRKDESQTWRGTMGSVDRDNATSQNNSNQYWGMMDSSGDSQTSSSSYPFYVEMESSDGLMLGQHVYIELDEGQGEKKDGLWLSDFFIVDADQENPYVWVSGDKDRLEKRTIILGNYDENLMEYEIVDGLTKEDYIAFPVDTLEEGMTAKAGTNEQTMQSAVPSAEEAYGMEGDTGEYTEEYPEGEMGEGEMVPYSEDGSYDEYAPVDDFDGEIIETPEMSGDYIESGDTEEYAEPEGTGEFIDEELVPVG